MRIDQRLTRVTDLYLFSAEKGIDKVELDVIDTSVVLDLAIGASDLKRENDKLREALKFYADKKVYKSEILKAKEYRLLSRFYHEPECIFDNGEKARKALEESK